jgi:putative ABC transport system substrate-binding protein
MRRREFIALLGSAASLTPRVSQAQPTGKIPKIGVLWHAGSAEEEGPYFKALAEGFRDLGYVEGRTIILEHRFPNEMPERFKAMAAELAALNVDVLVSVGNGASYAKNATTTIPVVFMLIPDPVGAQLVSSLARPGGNVTGFTNFAAELVGKRLQFLREIIPGLSRIAQLVNPNVQASRLHLDVTRSAASEIGLSVQAFEARSVPELEPAFDAMAAAGMQAVTVNPEGVPFQGRAIIGNLAITRRLALCAYSKETFESGALISYGASHSAICRHAPVYVDKILKGAKPSELPVQGPTKFEMFINLKTAKSLGLTIPPLVLVQSDETIE